MIFLGMDVQDIMREFSEDYLLLNRYDATRRSKMVGWFERRKQVKVDMYQWRSPRGNVWHVMYWRNDAGKCEIAQFMVIESTIGKFVLKPQMTGDGFLILFYLPHFIKRYRQRMKLGSKMTTMQVIRRYIRNNATGTTHSYPGRVRMYFEVTTNEGVGLGTWINLRARLMKTFITYDMTYGEQRVRIEESKQRHIDRADNLIYYDDEVGKEMKMFGLSEEEYLKTLKYKTHEKEANNQSEGDGDDAEEECANA